MEKQKEYQQNYDKDWYKPGRKFLLFLILRIIKKYIIFMTFKMERFIGIMIMMMIDFMILMSLTLILI
jgi:hypothetical protein